MLTDYLGTLSKPVSPDLSATKIVKISLSAPCVASGGHAVGEVGGGNIHEIRLLDYGVCPWGMGTAMKIFPLLGDAGYV